MKSKAAPGHTTALAYPDATASELAPWHETAVIDDAEMARAREWAATLVEAGDLSLRADHAVMGLVRDALADGRLHENAVALKRLAFVAPRPAPAPPPPRAPAPAPRPRAPAAPAAAATRMLDVAAMVAVLRQAARDGVPFCEECERAAAQGSDAGATT
jgi:hypothetical protein